MPVIINIMAEVDLNELEKIGRKQEVIDFLVGKGIIKEKKFLKQLKYEQELNDLQYDLLKMQLALEAEGKRVLVIFEGRDAAGKGGTISRLIAKLNPKKYRVVSLSKPTETEQKEWYFQRYIKELPRKGELVFFDRSWYNRAVVEPVFGFCSKGEYEQFMKAVLPLEKRLVKDGLILIKIFLSISKEEQHQRLEDRKSDPGKSWKIGPLDAQAQKLWDSYTHYIDDMLKETHAKKAPWTEIQADDKKSARLEAARHILKAVKGD